MKKFDLQPYHAYAARVEDPRKLHSCPGVGRKARVRKVIVQPGEQPRGAYWWGKVWVQPYTMSGDRPAAQTYDRDWITVAAKDVLCSWEEYKARHDPGRNVFECSECGRRREFEENDFICKVCRRAGR